MGWGGEEPQRAQPNPVVLTGAGAVCWVPVPASCLVSPPSGFFGSPRCRARVPRSLVFADVPRWARSPVPRFWGKLRLRDATWLSPRLGWNRRPLALAASQNPFVTREQLALHVQAPGLPPPRRRPCGRGGRAVRAPRGAVPSCWGPAPFAPSASSLAFSVENEGTGTQGVWHCVPGPALVGGGDLASPSACFPGPCLAVLGERPQGLLQAWSLSPRLRPAPEDPSDT